MGELAVLVSVDGETHELIHLDIGVEDISAGSDGTEILIDAVSRLHEVGNALDGVAVIE